MPRDYVPTPEEQYQASLPWFVQEFPGQYTATTYNGQTAYKDATGQIMSGTGAVLYRPPGWQEYQDALKAAHPGTGENFFKVMGSGITALAKEPVVGLVISYFLPGVGSAIASELVSAGVMAAGPLAEATGLAIANTVSGIAQGQTPEKALANAVTNAAVNYGSIEVAKVVNGVLSSPAVTNAIVSAGASAVKTAVGGGNEDDVAKAALSGLISSGTTSLVSNAVNASPDIANIVGSAAGGYVAGGEKGAITSALSTAASQLGDSRGAGGGRSEYTTPVAEVSAPTPVAETSAPVPVAEVPAPVPTPVAEVPMNAQGVLAAFDEAAKKDYVNSSTAFAGAGMIPAATAETQVLLARLASTPAGQAALREAASASEKIRTAIVASGIISAGALSGFIGGQQLVPQAQTDKTIQNPAFALIPTTGGDPGTAAAARETFAATDPRRVDTSTQTPPAPTPVKISTQRVAQNLNISTEAAAQLQNTNPILYSMFGDTSSSAGFTPADIETMPIRDRLMLENIASGAVSPTGIEIPSAQITTAETTPTSAGENVVIAVDSSTGDALIISPTGVVSTVKVEPDTRTGTSVVYDPQARIIINPQTNTITSIDTNITSRVDSSKISEAVNTATTDKTKTATDVVAAPDIKTKTATDTLSGPLVQPTPSVQPKAGESFAPTTPTTTSVTSPTGTPSLVPPVAATPSTKTPSFTFKTPSAITPTTTTPTTTTEPVPSSVKEPVKTSLIEETVPDEFYKPNIKVFTSKTPPKTPATTSPLSQALGTTTGLTAYRGAGEIEDPSTGKKRRNVWNEETLRLKDALGV
jgi:hypothetical protein